MIRDSNDKQVKVYTFKEARKLAIKIKEFEGLSKYSIKAYNRVFNDLDKFFGKETDATKLTIDDARDYIYWQLHEKTPYQKSSRQDFKNQKGVSINTANNYLILAQAVFNVFEKEGITYNIFKPVKQIKEHEEVVETLSVDEINQLFKTFDKRAYTEFRGYVA